MFLFRDTCSSPQFKLNDTLSWSTRVCYKWVCDTSEYFIVSYLYNIFFKFSAKYAMRVESCWIGTPKMPVFIVRDDGCTIEKAILTSPVYTSFNRAAAIGWMAVRQKSKGFFSRFGLLSYMGRRKLKGTVLSGLQSQDSGFFQNP